MNLTDEQYERMMRFMDADMDMGEMETFERELALNPELRSQFAFEQSLRDGLIAGENKAADEKQENFQGTVEAKRIVLPPAKPAFSSAVRKWISIAVAASVVLVLGLFMVFREKKATPPIIAKGNDTATVHKDSQQVLVVAPPQKEIDTVPGPDLASLYKAYYKKDTLPAEYPMQIAEALAGYEKNDYKGLRQLDLSKIDIRGMEEDEINSKENILQTGHYYKGLALIETGQTDKAITELNWVIVHAGSKDLRVKAEWYAALGYLKLGEREKAAESLEKVAEGKNLFQLKAKALLEKIGLP